MNHRRIASRPSLLTMPFLLVFVFIILLSIILPSQASGLQDVFTPTSTLTPEATPSPTPTVDPNSALTWLSTPNDASGLASSQGLVLLAGQLIYHDLVDGSSCPNYGLLNSGAANPCGEEKARNAGILWQNQFDQAIYDAAEEYNVPPFVLKNVIYTESQFWPASHPTIYGYSEMGLGHITQMGADTLLRWNSSFYNDFCRTVYDGANCKTIYAFQKPEHQAVLRGAVIQALSADCGNCKGGVDIDRARASIPIIAATLRANYLYTNWLLQGLTSRNTEKAFEPTDIWRFTLASYNAGPGCMSKAIRDTRTASEKIAWKPVSKHFEKTCAATINYVDNVTNVYLADPLALANASTDQSTAAHMVFAGLGITSPTPTLDVSTATAVSTEDVTSQTPVVPTSDAASQTPLATDLTPTSLTPAETPTGGVETTPTSTPVPVTETAMQESPTATSTPVPSDPTPHPDVTVSGEVVVKFNNLVPEFLAEAVISSAGGEVQGQVDALGLTVISAPEEDIPQLIESLQSNLLVDYAEPNYVVEALFTPNDPGYEGQGYLLDMQVPEAWDVTQGQGIVVAVIDTGVDVSHPDLAGNVFFNAGEFGADGNGNEKSTNGVDDDDDGYIDNFQGWNFVNTNPDAVDLNGHGTHSAGIIAAQMDNGFGLAGIAPQAKIMTLKALDDNGRGSYSHVAEAIIYAVDHGAKVINLGFGGTAGSEALLAATNYAYDHDVVVVAAGGNTGAQTLFYPAANPNVIGVTAVDGRLNISSFSSSSSAIQISAPGVDIYSTTPNETYTTMNGTSMSAAQVSGVAALLATQPKFDTVDKVREALLYSALDLGAPGLDAIYGYGFVRALDALNYELGSVVPFVSNTPDPNATPLPDNGVSLMMDAPNTTLADYTATCSTTAYNSQLTGTPVGITANNALSSPIDLPFEFWYLGTRYTQVYTSSNGWLSFGNPNGNNYAFNNLATGGNTAFQIARPLLAPLWDDLNPTQSGTSARWATGTDSSGNQTFIFEWWNYQWGNAAGISRISFRVILHANTGVIDYLYFNNNATALANASASIGLTGSGTGSGAIPPSFKRVTDVSCVANPWTNDGTVADPGTLATRPPDGQMFTFTPPLLAINAPTNLNLTNVTGTTATVNWIDNSTSEDAFGIYNSTDGISWNLVTNIGTNTQAGTGTAYSYNATGLILGANYHWRVFGVTEAVASPVIVLASPASLSFTGIDLNSMTINWPTVANAAAYLVYSSTDGVSYTLATTTTSTSYDATGLTPKTIYYWRVNAVAPGGIGPWVAGFQSTPFAVTGAPTVTIISPTASSFTQGASVSFIGSAIIPTNGDISSRIVWSSDLDGVLCDGASTGNCASFGTTDLSVGTHTITAQITDIYGRNDAKTVTVTINALPASGPNPHDGFNGSTDKCAICHRPHAALGSPALTNSALNSNDFCLSCHSADVNTVSTHSNSNWVVAGSNPRFEGEFVLECIQCHSPHGHDAPTSTNFSNIRTNIWLNTITLPPSDPEAGDQYLSTGPVNFSTRSGLNSFDDGTSPDSNRICYTCHSNAANPGGPMTLHNGGALHANGTVDYSGTDCTICHPHSLDSSFTTHDGFSTTCRACHSMQQPRTSVGGVPARRQIVGTFGQSPAASGDFYDRTTNGSHHVTGNDSVTDADCLVCHELTQHKQGRVRLYNADNPATVYALNYTYTASAPSQADADTYDAFCISCHDSNGKAGNTTPFSDKKLVPAVSSLWGTARHNGTFAPFLGSCVNCHDNGHGSNKAKLLAPWNFTAAAGPDSMQQEEKFCFTCHTTTPGKPVAPAFSNWNNTTTSIFEHDVSVDRGLAHGKEVFGSSFSNRHIECGDCHEPHDDAYPNTAAAPAIKFSQRGATGVEPTWPAAGGVPTSYAFLSQATNEYQVCFKCHSSYTTLPTYVPDGWNGTTIVANGLYKLTASNFLQKPDSRDLALEFNPATGNADYSFHPVTAQGKNQTPLFDNASFASTSSCGGVTPCTKTSRVFCSDCHSNANPTVGGEGPHGSGLLHILRDAVDDATYDQYTTVWRTRPNTNEVCFRCHRSDVYMPSNSRANALLTRFRNGTSNNLHSRHVYSNSVPCYTCHDSHGSENGRLINMDTSVVPIEPGYNSQTVWEPTYDANGNTTTASCFVDGGGCHSSDSYTP